MRVAQTSCISVVIALIFLISLAAGAQPAINGPLRILLNRNNGSVKRITVRSLAGIVVTGADGAIASADKESPMILEAGAEGVVIRRSEPEPVSRVTISPALASGIIELESPGKRPGKYRGAIEVSSVSGSLRLVNIVPVEDYLLGVLPAEMPDGYPREALRAQAVCARTYAVRNRGRHASEGCDLCDSGHCQVYGGVLSEKPNCAAAVRDTTGQLVTFDGAPASVLYCADCGGFTDDSPSSGFPYLRGAQEPVEIAHISWEYSLPLAELGDKLALAGVKEASGLKSIAVIQTSPSGRARTVELTGDSGTAGITAERLRGVLGASTLKSTLFTIETSTDAIVTFKGKGFGHGLGLCQVGARGLAGPPYNYTYDRILAHYFPGTQVQGFTPPMQAAATKKPPTPQGKITFQVRVKAPESL